MYIVPTPIGNLKDITLRALEVLEKVDLVLAEDTRKTGNLLKHYHIKKTLRSYHNFNEHRQLSVIINLIKKGNQLALVTDAGTPLVSDPGYLLVRECLKENLKVECLPGPTSFIPALVKSGLPAESFVFEGFLPHKKGRKTRLEALSKEKRTIILFESPHRLLKTIQQLIEFLGEEREASISRELTKIHEETINGTLQELLEYFKLKKIKGEIVIVLNGNT